MSPISAVLSLAPLDCCRFFASTGLDWTGLGWAGLQDDDEQEPQYDKDSNDGGGFGYVEDNDNDNDNEGGVNDDLVGAAFGAKERTKHGDYSAFEHPLERRANELKQNDCKVHILRICLCTDFFIGLSYVCTCSECVEILLYFVRE